MSTANGYNPMDAGDHYTAVYYDLVRWDFTCREWEPRGYEFDWTQAKEALHRKRSLYPMSGVAWRIVKVEVTYTHTDMTPLAERELGV